jgi:hypothetical protein
MYFAFSFSSDAQPETRVTFLLHLYDAAHPAGSHPGQEQQTKTKK